MPEALLPLTLLFPAYYFAAGLLMEATGARAASGHRGFGSKVYGKSENVVSSHWLREVWTA